jgi:hypothetical protein
LIPEDLFSPTPPKFELHELNRTYAGKRLSNFIQMLVLYDAIVVDSLLFDSGNVGIQQAYSEFPEIIRGVFVGWRPRREIGKVLDRTIPFDRPIPPDGISRSDWGQWQLQDSSEKPLMDRMSEATNRYFPEEFRGGIPKDEQFELDNNMHLGIPRACLNSTMTLARAHFYLEIARYLGISYSPDPVRSLYFQRLTEGYHDALKQGMPERVLALADNYTFRSTPSEFENILSVDLSIPPVAEMAVRYAKKKRCCLAVAVHELRDSPNAKRFRDWTAELVQLTEDNRAGNREAEHRLKDLQRVCELWRNDPDEEVKYRSRTLNLQGLPVIGGVLKGLNMFEKVALPDPVLVINKPHRYFLFINDLYRSDL